ncbi:MAG: extracellular solute-binding protein [Candidatus Merdivicinus sp.]|jgi:putative aldouronate transport system substrate-binding protein
MAKKQLALRISAVLLAASSLLASCGDSPSSSSPSSGASSEAVSSSAPENSGTIENFNETGYPIVNEKITLTMMHTLNTGRGDWSELAYFQDMEELTNIHWEFVGVASENWAEKKNLALASGDYPDLFWAGTDTSDEQKYGVDTGVFQNIKDLIPKYMPNLSKVLADNPDAANGIKASDGNIYMLPYLADTLTMADSTIYYRKDWLKKVGKEVPTTVDELTDVLRAIKTLGDDIYPLMPQPNTSGNNAAENFLYAAFGEDLEPHFVVDENGTVSYSPLSEQFEHFITYMNALYTEQLLDNECYTQTTEQATAKLKNNQAGFVTWGTGLTAENFESGELEVGLLAPLTSEYYDKQHVRKYSGIYLGYGVITDKNKYPEATLRYLDINYAEEEVAPDTGLYCLAPWLGPEGKGFEFTNAEKTTYARLKPADSQLSELEYTDRYWAPGTGPCRLVTDAVPEKNPGQEMKASESKANWYPYMVPGFPDGLLRYESEDFDRMTTLWTDINSYYLQCRAKFVSGQMPLSEMDTFRETLKKMGIDEVVAIKQKAYNKFIGK